MYVNFVGRVFYMWHYADAPERYGTVAEAPAVLPAFGLPTAYAQTVINSMVTTYSGGNGRMRIQGFEHSASSKYYP
jgi:hypothetical protein